MKFTNITITLFLRILWLFTTRDFSFLARQCYLQRYYCYNSFRRCCVFLRFSFLCSLQPDCLNPCHQAPNLETRERYIKKHFFVLISHSYFFLCFKFNAFVFIVCLCFFIATNKIHSKKQAESNEKIKIAKFSGR